MISISVSIATEYSCCVKLGFMEGYTAGQQQDAHEFMLCCIKQIDCDAR